MKTASLGPADFEKFINDLPALRHNQRKGVEFIPFDPEIVDSYCGSSYVIPFVSETEFLATRRSNGRWVFTWRHIGLGKTCCRLHTEKSWKRPVLF